MFLRRTFLLSLTSLCAVLSAQTNDRELLFTSKWDQAYFGLAATNYAVQTYNVLTAHSADKKMIAEGDCFIEGILENYFQETIVASFKDQYGLSLDVCFCVGLTKTFVTNGVLYVNISPLIMELLSLDFSVYSEEQIYTIENTIIFGIRHELARGLIYERSWLTNENALYLQNISEGLLQNSIYAYMRSKEYGKIASFTTSFLPALIPSFALKKIERDAILCDEIAGDSLNTARGGIDYLRVLSQYQPYAQFNNSAVPFRKKMSLISLFELPCDERIMLLEKRAEVLFIEALEQAEIILEKEETEQTEVNQEIEVIEQNETDLETEKIELANIEIDAA